MHARAVALLLSVLSISAHADGSVCSVPKGVEVIAYGQAPTGLKRLLGDIAMPGAKFNAGDVAYPGIPMSRLIAIWHRGADHVVAIERGGRGGIHGVAYRWAAPNGTELIRETEWDFSCEKLKNIFGRDHLDYRHASGMTMHVAYSGMPPAKARKFADTLVEPVWSAHCSQTSEKCLPRSAYALRVDAAPGTCSVNIAREQSGELYSAFTWFACSFDKAGRLVRASAP